jgi:O-antigen/teichoic acid export membrane protein
MKSFLKRQIKSEESDIKNIWRRIRTRDFSGNTGMAVKNSVYNFSTTLISKFGSLLFVVILARLLMPELFGLYNLALSTILIFAAISELGIGQAIIRFVSRSLGKNNKKKAKNYMIYLGKIKFLLTLLGVLLLLIFSKFIAETYYQKPIFLALLAGVFYISFVRFASFFNSILNSFNNFRNVLFKETLFQISRIILVPLIVVCAMKLSLSDELILFYMILALAISYLITGAYLLFVTKKKSYLKPKGSKSLSKEDKKDVNRFVLLTAVISLSGVFFGNIDKIMLGRFVAGEFIGYYQAAFSLITALTSLSAFGVVLLPIFSRMKDKDRKRAMRKTLKTVFLISLGIFVLTLAFSNLAVLIIYGSEYLSATNILRLFSILILILPVTGLYLPYFMSENRPEVIAKSLGLSTLLNIALNYILITSLLQFGQLQAVYGALVATIISKGVYLGMLVWWKK